MTEFNQHFVRVPCPLNDEDGIKLSIKMTQEYGLGGWQLISMQYISNDNGKPVLLLAFQK